ncbi:hypothetical protein CAP36_12080 [Chitinophagaceae bacterium IBVUCB2]|nr:hypothetical protein CAP36_12080 [Chitinophagaceae bacterium IBVUCB2]
MCFSATASFISGTALCVIGVATLKQTKATTEIPFALIPLLFGIQQLTEGVIWLSFNHNIPVLRQVMTYIYSLFSHLLWPIYVPFAIGIIEVVKWRKKALLVLLVLGVTVGLFLLYWITVGPLNAEVISHHMVYISPHFYSVPVMILYFTATCASCFFSSHGFIRLLGVLLVLSLIGAQVAHSVAFVSIWCFFAAIISMVVYLHLKIRNRGWGPKNLAIIRDGNQANYKELN